MSPWMRGFYSFLGSIFFFVSLLGAQEMPPEILAYADLVLYNGKILTADDKFTISSGLAVRSGRILAVGEDSKILRLAGPATEKIDLKGKSVVPGFIDVHSTNTVGGTGPQGPTYLGSLFLRSTNMEEWLNAVKEAAGKKKAGEWIFVSGRANKESLKLDRHRIDAVAPKNPVLITYDGVLGLVNSEGLKHLPLWDPQIAQCVFKDGKGEPTGWVKGWAYGWLIHEGLPWPEPQQVEKMIQEQKELLKAGSSWGITAIGCRTSGLSLTILKELYLRGELPMRVRVALEVPKNNAHAEWDFRRLGNLQGIGDEWFKIAAAAIAPMDGIGDTAGYYFLRPKRFEPPDAGAFVPYGQNKFDTVQGADWRQTGSDFINIILSNRYGWSLTDVHIVGDGAMDVWLEAWERARTEKPLVARGNSFANAHGGMITRDQLKRLAQLDGAIVQLAPRYVLLGKEAETLELLQGKDAVYEEGIVANSAIKAGLKPVLETNFRYRIRKGDTLSALAPPEGTTYLALLERLITRKNEETGQVWNPKERITREQALWMATSWASRVYGDERIMGTIEPGKLADLVILGEDYMTVPEDKISEIPILRVIIGGKPAYQHPNAIALLR